MEELRKEGHTYREIGEAVGLTRNQVKEYFRRDRREIRTTRKTGGSDLRCVPQR